jgi:aminopeptidase N
MGKNVTHLIKQFAPANYDITLDLNETELTFQGNVIIKGKKVGRPSKRITLHQKGLTIASASITKHDKRGDTTASPSRIVHHASYDEVRLHSDETLYPGNYTIELEFSGTITKPMDGIYPCFFKHEGKPKQLLATQFESHHAREAFPCIDEPAAKAIFQLTLITNGAGEVISNTPISVTKSESKRVRTTFEPTPIMSSYLLAFVTGEMGYTETTSRGGTTIRVYATPDNVKYTDFALQSARDCLDYYEDYFGIPYPLAKCDFIALPDFASGAMENWGAITFREQTCLSTRRIHHSRQAARVRGSCARACPPMVWQSRHYAVVDRPVAKRRLC